ncbi:MAG: FHA domain-containing protein [Planctomycetota bacterium]
MSELDKELLTLGEVRSLLALRGEGALTRLFGEDPVLVIRLDEEDDGLFNTPQRSYRAEPLDDTKVSPSTAVMERSPVLSKMTRSTNRVVPVRKSERNPFAGLITIGRARNNDLRLRSARISKMHGWLSCGPDGGWRIKDHDSTNGTFVNGERAEKGAEVPVRSGDELCLGDVEALFLDLPGLQGLCALLASD